MSGQRPLQLETPRDRISWHEGDPIVHSIATLANRRRDRAMRRQRRLIRWAIAAAIAIAATAALVSAIGLALELGALTHVPR